jgi:trimethylamine--corrinoid protein Co-methyltransferase
VIHTQTNVSAYMAPFFRGLTNGNRVRIPAHLAEWALRTAPSRITLYDRRGNPAMRLGDRISTYGTGSDCLNILDHRTGERRKAVLQDVVEGIRVADAMPHIDFIMSMFLPNDVGVAQDVQQMAVMLTHSAKPICFVTYEWAGTPEIIEMLEVAVGDAERLRTRPTAILYLNPTSGFRHNEEALRKLMYVAERHLPCIYWPEVGRGLTCPITFAGGMACSNAGHLAGLVIAQLVSEGAPVTLCTAMPFTLDMKTMVVPYADPDCKAFGLEMSRYYNLPAFNWGGMSDSKLLDEQAVMEAGLTLFAATVSGGNLIHDIGYMESGLTGSLELVVICDEIVSWLIAFTKGLEISEETLALDLIHEHGLSGDFLETAHTLHHVRDDWQPRLVDRHNYDQWVERGATSMRERARAKIDEILCAEPERILPLEIEQKIKSIAQRAVVAQTEKG